MRMAPQIIFPGYGSMGGETAMDQSMMSWPYVMTQQAPQLIPAASQPPPLQPLHPMPEVQSPDNLKSS